MKKRVKKFLEDNLDRIINNYNDSKKDECSLYNYICTDVLESYLSCLATDITIQLIPLKEVHTYTYSDLGYIKKIYPNIALEVLKEKTYCTLF